MIVTALPLGLPESNQGHDEVDRRSHTIGDNQGLVVLLDRRIPHGCLNLWSYHRCVCIDGRESQVSKMRN